MAEIKARTKEAEYTKYEIARIIGARALQISMNAPLLLNLKKDELEQVDYDSLKIAALEFKSGILPITVKRPFPKPKRKEGEKEEPVSVPVEEKKEQVPPAEMAEEPEEEIEETEEETEPEE